MRRQIALICDYLINIQLVDKSIVEKNYLQENISLLKIPNAKIVSDVVRIAGNSETHFFRDGTFDVEDMFKCLNALIAYLVSEYISEEYKDKIPETKRTK